MTDYIETLLQEQEEQDKREEQEEQSFFLGTEGGESTSAGGHTGRSYGEKGEVRAADTGTGRDRAEGEPGETRLVRWAEKNPAAFEVPVLEQKDEKNGVYQVTGTGRADRLYLTEANGVPGAETGADREAGGTLRRRLQRAAAVAAYHAPLPEARGHESLAAEGPSLLALDAAVQRDARRYDGGFELF